MNYPGGWVSVKSSITFTTMGERKEFKHPVLQMMGIPRIRVPGRNWLIFWGVTSSLVGAYYWDRRERKKVRNYWVDRVSSLGEEPISPLDVSRKLKVYIAPPPNDFIDAGLQHWRNFIKPAFTAAAVDHVLIEEERQGYIRTKVAEEVRSLRKKLQSKEKQSNDDTDSKWHKDLTGGIVIIGRGAYKEYMAGLQEGWFGPIERPAEVQEQMDKEKEAEKERLRKRHEEKAKATDGESQLDYDNEQDYEEDRLATLHRRFPVIPAYVRTTELDELELPSEFAAHVPDPISVFDHPHLVGIFSTPQRIYRWLNQRHLAEEMGSQAVGVINAHTRPFDAEDANLALSDEADWPNQFKRSGLDKDSEWMRDFRVDMRLGKDLKVYTKATRESDTNSE